LTLLYVHGCARVPAVGNSFALVLEFVTSNPYTAYLPLQFFKIAVFLLSLIFIY